MIKEIDLRILTFIECETKMKKITEILNFFNTHNIKANLSMLYDSEISKIRAENLLEYKEMPSLTIDLRDGLLRFKYWNGLTIYWTYHIDDLFKSINKANTEYSKIYDKYSPITQKLMNWKDQNEEIRSIRYEYYPQEKVDVGYTIYFDSDMKNNPKVDILMKEAFELFNNIYDDLSMTLDYAFKSKCSACEKRRKNEESNRSNNEH